MKFWVKRWRVDRRAEEREGEGEGKEIEQVEEKKKYEKLMGEGQELGARRRTGKDEGENDDGVWDTDYLYCRLE